MRPCVSSFFLFATSLFASCMQAEKISLDASGLEGLLLSGVSLAGGLASNGESGQSMSPPTMLSSTPTTGATVAPNVPFTGLSVDFDVPLDATSQPAVQIEMWNGAGWEAISNLNVQTSISSTRLTLLTGLIYIPENSQLRITVTGAGLRSNGGTAAITDFTMQFSSSKMGQRVLTTGSARLSTTTSAGADIVVDGTTHMRWTKCVLGTAVDCSGTPVRYTQAQGMGACTALNRMNGGAGYAGRTNWRLPSIDDLESLPDFERAQPVTPADRFPAVLNELHWSMSGVTPASSIAWAANPYTGETRQQSRVTQLPVRCVSDETGFVHYASSSGVSGRWGTAEDGVSTSYVLFDLFSGHYFTACPQGYSTNSSGGFYTCELPQTVVGRHPERIAVCAAVAGRQAPTIDQLLLTLNRDRPTTQYRNIDLPSGSDSVYWSSTSVDASNAYAVDFATGEVRILPKADSHAIRCLRTSAPF